MNHKQQAIQELTNELLGAGYRVFIAESGQYGFYTDKEGSRIVSFQVDYLSPRFSGNYRSKSCGTGWGLDEQDSFEKMFNEYPPRWATKGENVKVTTLDEHLDFYQKSSKYTEILEPFAIEAA